jgi:molybdopterin/thiamine biosynthesis adenylyltransferase
MRAAIARSQVKLLAPDLVWQPLRRHLLAGDGLERAAIGFCGIVKSRQASLLLRDWTPVRPDEYLVQLPYHLEVSPTFWARAAKRARTTGEALVIAHSHPGSRGVATFSPTDDAGELLLVPKLQARADVPIASLVVNSEGASGRIHKGGPAESVALEILTERLKPASPGWSVTVDDRFERQVRLIGQDGQHLLRSLRVAIAGVGGLGSHVAQQLLHLGVGQITAIDPDLIDPTNLSRVIGVRSLDVHREIPKVEIAARLARSIGTPTQVSTIKGDITEESVARIAAGHDLIVGCTDNQWSRSVLNSLAYQYLIPVLDLGVELQSTGAMGGRLTWLLPGEACLWCRGVLDPDRVRIEQLPQGLRQVEHERGYVSDVDIKQPAVVSINGVIASLATTEILAYATGFIGSDRPVMLVYRLQDGTVRRVAGTRRPKCPTCSEAGTFAAGDLADPPWRVQPHST